MAAQEDVITTRLTPPASRHAASTALVPSTAGATKNSSPSAPARPE